MFEAFGTLEDLASKEGVIFRGHSDASWRLCSTLSRFTSIPHEGWDTLIDDLLTHFLEGLASVGQLPTTIDWKDRRSRLEYGRHYGVPSPLIDFTYSPYVATFFAFNGTRQDRDKLDEEVVVYALCTDELALHWASKHGTLDPNERQLFLYDNRHPMFEHGYPAGILKFLRSPASWNKRMQQQLGAFLYDTLDHKVGDLEGYIDKISEPSDSSLPALTKVFVLKSIASNVFGRLELMGMTGARLLDDHVGASADVQNSYNYNRITGTWDLRMPPPDDTKM
jgi:hypothetical protein